MAKPAPKTTAKLPAQAQVQSEHPNQVLMVHSRQPTGYRRAGLALTKGDNHFPLAELSPTQIAALKGDARLKVFETAVVVETSGSVVISNGDPSLTQAAQTQGADLNQSADITGTIAGVKDLDGTERNLAEMKVDELREIAISLEVTGAKGLKKDELIAAIQATEVQVPKDAIDKGTEPQGAETQGTQTQGAETQGAE